MTFSFSQTSSSSDSLMYKHYWKTVRLIVPPEVAVSGGFVPSGLIFLIVFFRKALTAQWLMMPHVALIIAWSCVPILVTLP